MNMFIAVAAVLTVAFMPVIFLAPALAQVLDENQTKITIEDIQNQLQQPLTINTTEESGAADRVLEDIFESRRQQKEQEKILNLTQLWLDAGLVHLREGEYIPSLLPPSFLPADIVYQGNNTIVVESGSLGGGDRFWNAVEIVQAQGFEIKDTMVLPDKMSLDVKGDDYNIDSVVQVVLVK